MRRRRKRAEAAEPRIVDGVEVNGQHLAALVDDGSVFIACPADFMIASFELGGSVHLSRRTAIPISQWPQVHLRLPAHDSHD